MDYSKPASKESLERASLSLKENGIDAFVVTTSEEAKKKLFEILPLGSSVMNMTSVTLDTTGISKEILESGKYDPVRTKLMDKDIPAREKRMLGAAPDYVVGSVHAVTEDGHVMIASNTGSQLPAYAYGAGKVIWIVGAQKVVKNIDEGMKRIYKHSLVLESERARKAYGTDGSFVSKVLIVNKEVQAGRMTLILVHEALGF